MIRITKEAQDMLKIFEIVGNNEKKEIKEIKKSVDVIPKEYKRLEDDEIAECITCSLSGYCVFESILGRF